MRSINEHSMESTEKDSLRKRDLIIDPNQGQGVGPGVVAPIPAIDPVFEEEQSFPWLLVATVAVIAIFAVIMVVRICRKRKTGQDSKKEEKK